MTLGFQRIGLTFSESRPEREDHVMGVEGAAYKVRYRPVQSNSAMAIFSHYTSCLSLELRFLPAVMEVIKVALTLLRTRCILPLQLGPIKSWHYGTYCGRSDITASNTADYYTEHVRILNITFPDL
jgi:hypothetical protein